MWQRAGHPTFDRIWMYRERRPRGLAYQTQRVIKRVQPDRSMCPKQAAFPFVGPLLRRSRAKHVQPAHGSGRWLVAANREACQ